LWAGGNKHKGLGVFARSPVTLAALNWQSENAQLFLPCRVDDAFNLLAVWTKNAADYAYIGQLWRYLQQQKDALSASPAIICGDLNSNTCWDQRGRVWNHSNVVRELEEIGFYSAYHLFHNEAQGRESKPTLYMQRNLEKSYHIDYIFMPKSLIENGSSVAVGESSMWLQHSDHMRVILNV
jgi:endonuclease/exonuclease/phosphatase family metal-dependent hydrolase